MKYEITVVLLRSIFTVYYSVPLWYRNDCTSFPFIKKAILLPSIQFSIAYIERLAGRNDRKER